MALIEGFVNQDQKIIQEVNRKALYSLLVIVALTIGIILMVSVLIWIAKTIGTYLFS